MALKGVKLSDIKTVESHVHALGSAAPSITQASA